MTSDRERAPRDPALDLTGGAARLPADVALRAAVSSSLSFTVSDPHRPDDPLVWANPAFTAVTGYAFDDVVGRNCRFLQGPDTDPAAVRRISAALRRGEAAAETLLNHRKDGTPFWNQVVVSPVRDAEGRVTHHVGIQADVTRRVESEAAQRRALADAQVTSERLALAATISQALVELFDERAGVERLPELVAPHLGDWCFATLLDEWGRPVATHVRAAAPAKAPAAAVLEASDRWFTGSPRLGEALERGNAYEPRPFMVDTATLPSRTTTDELAALHELGLGSAIIVPLRGRDRAIGLLTIVCADPHGLADDTVATILDLGRRAGTALDNARLYAREHHAAVTLQHSLLPRLTTVPGLECAASYLPASAGAAVGGDWYDVLRLPDGAVGLAVGDVAGHDIRAAASMGQLRSVLRSAAWTGESPAAALDALDDLVRGLGMADVASCVLARLAPADDGPTEVRYARAGHPPPLLVEPDGTVRVLDGALTTPLGVRRTVDLTDARAALAIDATLVLYTDGLLERRDRGQREGLELLVETARSLPRGASATGVRDALVRAMVGEVHDDDVCVLVVRRTPEPLHR